MRCLVTGATGFVGGGVLRGLQAVGHELVAYVREGSDSRELADIERVVGDIGDPTRLAMATSADASGDTSRVVGYGAWAFSQAAPR